MQPEPNLLKPQRLPKTRARLAAVNGRIVHHPNDHATGLDDSPQLLRDAFEVP
jgi:hypothetical protein